MQGKSITKFDNYIIYSLTYKKDIFNLKNKVKQLLKLFYIILSRFLFLILTFLKKEKNLNLVHALLKKENI